MNIDRVVNVSSLHEAMAGKSGNLLAALELISKLSLVEDYC